MFWKFDMVGVVVNYFKVICWKFVIDYDGMLVLLVFFA